MLLIIVSFLVMISMASAGVAIYLYQKYKDTNTQSSTGLTDEVKDLTGKISKFIQLPNENPTIVTINDKSKLQDQPFFQKSVNGDKILIYEIARRLILYRPSTGKVIDIVPLVYTTPAIQNTNTVISTSTPSAIPLKLIESPTQQATSSGSAIDLTP